MKIAIDVMGGDFAPEMALKGIWAYLDDASEKLNRQVEIYAFGEQEKVESMAEFKELSSRIQFIPCGSSVDFSDSSVKVFKEKPESSLARGFQFIATDEADAFISAGHTGAMLVGAHTIVKPFPDVLRPSIGAVVPRKDGHINPGFVVDVGSCLECKPEQYNQLAILGTVYLQTVFNLKHPTVGLLNIGEESSKGTATHTEAYKLLQNNPKINFVGNVEGRDILTNKVNVVVCDGFVGNVVIKMAESIYDVLQLKDIQNAENSFYKFFDFEEHGGTPVLGVRKPIIIGHGISTQKAFKKMISLAAQLVEDKFCQNMEQALMASPSA